MARRRRHRVASFVSDQVRQFFDAAFRDFLKAAAKDVVAGAHEQNLCGQLAQRLEKLKIEFGFGSYCVDLEYNRMLFDNVKKIFRNGESVEIRSDLIVHIKGTVDNLIALEMKKADHSTEGLRRRETDRQRLMAMTTSCEVGGHPAHVCGYKLGLFVELDGAERAYLIEEFKDGEAQGVTPGAF